jgi:hypothetical protein
MWKTFLNKIGQDKDLSLEEVGKAIVTSLQPIWEKIKE